MKQTEIHSSLVAACAVVFVLSLAWSTSAGDLASIIPDDFTPSQLHQYLGQQKAEALDRSRRAQLLATSMPAANQTDYDVKWYDITIRVNDTTEILYGTVTFLAEAVVGGLDEVEVDFSETMGVDGITAASGPLAYTRAGDVVTIALDRTYGEGETFSFDFQYSGHPVEGGLQAFSFGSHLGKPAISSLSEPYFARTWWPCKDRMDDKPDSIGIHIEVDTALYCASNGTLDSITTVFGSNSRSFHYTCHYPIATYLFSVAIAPYVVWEQEYIYDDGQGSMPVIHHVYTDWYANSVPSWGETPNMIATLSDYFGPYPFLNEKYGHANFDWGGAMEHQTMTSMVGSSFGFYWATIVHELGHQWWGDLVTCKSWEDIWLNEGWASYSEAVYELATGGWTDYHNYMNTMAYKGGGSVWCDDTTQVWRIFNGNLSYDKGAWVVHMLRGVVGEDLFTAGIEAYRTAFAYDAATTAEFTAVWESATGMDLDPFINQWVYGQYYPVYDYYYMSELSDAGGYNNYLVVEQNQILTSTIFEMPVDFFFDYGSLPDDTLTLMVDERTELFKFNDESPVSRVQLDPSGWILKDATARAWEMFIITLDYELSDGIVGDAYVDTVETRGGSGPNDVRVLSGVLPPGLSISDEGIISGTPTQTGLYPFLIGIVNPATGYTDQRRYDLEIEEPSCCVGQVGDVNGTDGDEPTLGDISLLIDHLFISGAVIECLEEADANQSGGPEPTEADVTISDISVLIDHVFITGIDLPVCL